MSKKIKDAFLAIYRGVWFFPSVLIVIVLLLTAFKISGTSIGIYSEIFNGKNTKDSNLIYGEPQSIRSDEWLFLTQMIILQSKENFPKVNQNLNTGRDMSLNIDAPYRDWSVLFKPQNLIFFILPLEYAFAFKWWLLIVLLIISVYFFVLHFFKKKRLLAALLSLCFATTPFIFWWYQTATIAPLFYGFFILLLGMKIIESKKQKKNLDAFMVIGLSYLLISFALVLYPPFQIPIGLVVGFFLLGYLFDNKINNKINFRAIGLFAASIVLSLIIIGVFVIERRHQISIIESTVYPGNRIVNSGGYDSYKLFNTELQLQLQRESRGVNYFTNQSEASNFFLFFPFLLIVGLYLLYLQFRKKTLNYTFLLMHVLTIVFICHLFVSWFSPLAELFLLNRVPQKRMMIGVGLLGFIYLIYLLYFLKDFKLTKQYKKYAKIFSIIVMAIVLGYGFYTKSMYPKFISNDGAIIVLSIWFSFIIYLFILKRFIFASIFWLILSVISVINIHPVYRGLGPILHSGVLQRIDKLSEDKDTWIVVNDIRYENLPTMSGEDNLTGIQTYPDLDLWKNLNKEDNTKIYNRYSHLTFSSDKTKNSEIYLNQLDSFSVKLSCNNFVISHATRVLSTSKLDYPCMKLVDTMTFPNVVFYFYDITVNN